MKPIKSQRFLEWHYTLDKSPTPEEAFNAGWRMAIDQAILMMREREIEWKDSAADFATGVGVTSTSPNGFDALNKTSAACTLNLLLSPNESGTSIFASIVYTAVAGVEGTPPSNLIIGGV